MPADTNPEAGLDNDAPAGDGAVLAPDAGLPVKAEHLLSDQYGVAYAFVMKMEPAPHYELLRVASAEFLHWLRLELFRSTRKFPSNGLLKEFVKRMEAIAWSRGRHKLWNRFAEHDNAIWIDLADPLRRAIRVTASRWEIVTDPPPIFHRYSHQLPLVEPVRGGNADELFSHLPPLDEDDKLLVRTWLVAAYIPSIARPIMLPTGPHGSAKSTFSRRLRALLDPSLVCLLGEDHRRDLLLTFHQHALPAFDNVSPFSRRESDLFCRVTTGGGSVRRKLFTDADEVILAFHRAVVVNGIELPSRRPDFLDRSFILWVRRLEKLVPEDELEASFSQALPRLFGGVLDLLVATLAAVKTTPASNEFRMAAFARFGRAVAVASGKAPGDFDRAYRNALDAQMEEVIERNPVGQAVLAFMKGQRKLSGIARKDLFSKLEAIAENNAWFGERWPRTASEQGDQLLELAPLLLKRRSLRVSKVRRNGRARSRWDLEWVRAISQTATNEGGVTS